MVLGQTDFTTIDPTLKPTRTGMRNPTAVASDGVHLIVADTDSNRVLIWNTIPTQNNQPADVVVGQPDFTTNFPSNPPSAKSMSGPQGVWIQNGKLYVADTHNNRVLIFNSIPTSERRRGGRRARAAELQRRHQHEHRPGDAESAAQYDVGPGIGDVRWYPPLRGRSRLQPRAHLEQHPDHQCGAGGRRSRPAEHDQRGFE